MQQGRQQQEPTEATQGRFNAAPERRRNLRPLHPDDLLISVAGAIGVAVIMLLGRFRR